MPVHPNCRCSIGAWWKDETSYSKYDKVITDDDIQALNNYISSDSYRINEKLRLNIWDNDLQEKVHNLDSALSKMPIYDGKEPLQRDLFFMDYKETDKFIKKLSKSR
ncbi:ADP-ribosyltransferase, partial [Lactobacillus iners]|uniref:ADP-ribosyltransferase n=1 Tax=Lactobacillus iners TaxID=147802 RepID=UPI0034C68D4E